MFCFCSCSVARSYFHFTPPDNEFGKMPVGVYAIVIVHFCKHHLLLHCSSTTSARMDVKSHEVTAQRCVRILFFVDILNTLDIIKLTVCVTL